LLEVFGIKDKKNGFFLRPAFSKGIVDVTREMEQIVKKKDSTLALYPGDFALYRVGKFDEVEGLFLSMTAPEFIAEISAFVNPMDAFKEKAAEVEAMKNGQ